MKKMFMNIFALLLTVSLVTGCGCDKKEMKKEKNQKKEPEVKVEEKIKIIDMDSNSRPYAVVINNYPEATRVQSGLNEAYIVYEIPIEGGMTRSVALFKDKEDVKLGTIRSARQNHLDYALENDAIYVHFGWNVKAKKDIWSLGMEHIDGNSSDPAPFWRENPERLATEHTVYTNLSKIIKYTKDTKKYRTTTEVKPSLNYVTKEVNLKDGSVADSVSITYSYSYKLKFIYNKETKRYERNINGSTHKDYFKNEVFDTKNILLLTVGTENLSGHQDAAGNNYLNMKNIGTGNGYYITNGYAKEITWKKDSRNSQTTYTYKDGSKVEINDGNTYIVFHSKDNGVNIK